MPDDIRDDRSWRWTEAEGVPVLTATYRKQVFARHAHDHWVLGLVEDGACRSWYRGSNWTLEAGTIVLLPPGEVHDGLPLAGTPWVWRAIYPSADFVTRIAEDLFGPGPGVPQIPILLRGGGLPDIPVTVRKDREIVEQFLSVHRQLEVGMTDLESEASLVMLFHDLLLRHARAVRHPGHPRRETRGVQQARELIHARSQSRLTMEELANVAGLSLYNFIHAFKREVGIPPHAYLTQIRVERAKQMIHEGMDLATVALGSGFADQSHLTRRFRQFVGVTPGEYASRSA
jgi:AraC-like DNA-binding protein